MPTTDDSQTTRIQQVRALTMRNFAQNNPFRQIQGPLGGTPSSVLSQMRLSQVVLTPPAAAPAPPAPSPALWLAGSREDAGDGGFAWSNDGIIWNQIIPSIFTTGCSALAWNGSRWLAGGSGGNTLAYSPDGKTWTPVPNSTAIFSDACYAVAWNGTRWLAGGAGTNTLAYSPDGETWTPVEDNTDIFLNSCSALAWNGTRWVAGGYGNGLTNTLAYSDNNGENWTPVPNSNTIFSNAGNPSTCYALAWNGTRWLAGGQGTNTLAYSDDGETWTPVTSSPISPRCSAVVSNGSRFVAGGLGTNRLAYSDDNGETWTPVEGSATIFGNMCDTLAWNGSRIVAGGTTGDPSTNTLAYSDDNGETWIGLGNISTSPFSVSAVGYLPPST